MNFIRRRVAARRVHWTYHVNMHIASREVTRDVLYDSAGTFEIIEAYPEDCCRFPHALESPVVDCEQDGR